MRGITAALIVLLAGDAIAGAGDPVTTSAGAATVDWTRGLVTVKAIGTADRRAPSPAVARVGALREAEDRAAAALLVAASALPWAGGGTVGEAIEGDADATARLAAAAAAAVEVATDRLADGSVRISRGLPIEAIRQAIAGPRRIEPAWGGAVDAVADAPTALIIDARNLELDPGVGIAVSDGTTTVALPVLLVGRAPKDGDDRVGAHPVETKAVRIDAKQGKPVTVVLDGDARLEQAAAAGALVVLVVGVKG